MIRQRLIVISALTGLASACQAPLGDVVPLRQLAPKVLEPAGVPVEPGHLDLTVGLPRRLQYLTVQDWERATGTLSHAGGGAAALTRTVDATVNAELRRSARLMFSPVKPDSDYSLTLSLERRDAAGNWQSIASGALSGLTIAPGANTLAVPLAVTSNGRLTVSLPAPTVPDAPLLAIEDFYPTSGSPGMRIRLDGRGFATTSGGNAVSFNGTAATVLAGDTTTLQAVVPTGATSGPIGLAVGAKSASTSSFTVIASGALIGSFSVGTGPTDVATDADGNMWVANETSNNVSKLSEKGVLLGTYSVGAGPAAVAVNGSGQVWVANGGASTVSRLDANGNTIATYTVGAAPIDIAFDASGNAWVACNGANTLARITPGGVVTSVATPNGPRRLAFDAGGSIWCTSNGNGLSRYSAAGVKLADYPMGADAFGLAIDEARGFVWATDRNAKNLFQKQLADGSQVDKLNMGAVSEDVLMDRAGNLWVTQPAANSVARLRYSDKTVTSFAVGTTPSGIALAPSGAILVTNAGSNTVSVIAP